MADLEISMGRQEALEARALLQRVASFRNSPIPRDFEGFWKHALAVAIGYQGEGGWQILTPSRRGLGIGYAKCEPDALRILDSRSEEFVLMEAAPGAAILSTLVYCRKPFLARVAKYHFDWSAGKEINGYVVLAPAMEAFKAHELLLQLFTDQKERITVQFCPCGCVLQMTAQDVIRLCGGPQLSAIAQGLKRDAVTFGTKYCPQCRGESESTM